MGPQISAKTASFVKVAALASISRELLDDFGDFMGFLPQELARAVYDTETDQIINGNGTAPNMLGILHTAGLLTRAVGTDTAIDAIVRRSLTLACRAKLRGGRPGGTASRRLALPQVAEIHDRPLCVGPKRTKPVGRLGQHLRRTRLTNTKCPQSTAIVLDTNISCQAWTRLGMEILANQYGTYEFTQNAWTFRAEERVTVGVIRPTAICTVTGINPGGS